MAIFGRGVCFLMFVSLGLAQRPSSPVPSTAPTPKALPTLPRDPLQINVEATIYGKNVTSESISEYNYTAYFEEYRDSEKGIGLSIMINGSMEARYYYDLQDKQGITLTRDITTTPLNQAECTVTDLTSSAGRFFGSFSLESRGTQLIISNVSSFFQWSADKSPQYIGTDWVRGIPADKWHITSTSNVGGTFHHTNFTYYFSSGHLMPYYGDKAVPLRIVMDGSYNNSYGTKVFGHVYDLNLIAPLGEKDANFFSTPRGAYCEGRKAPGTELNYAEQYSLSEEVVVPASMMISNNKVFYDYTLQLTRTDIQFDQHSTYNFSNIRVIHDFNRNYQMVVINENGTCNVTNIPTTGGISSWDISTDGNGNPILPHTKDLPFVQNLQYQGNRVEKGIPVAVWASKASQPNNIVAITEAWYTTAGWSVKASQAPINIYNVTVGFYYHTYNKVTRKVSQELQSNTYNQFYGSLAAGVNLTLDVFDVPECYPRDAVSLSHLSLKVLDSERLFVQRKVTRDSLVRAIRDNLSKLSSITSTRFTNINVYDELTEGDLPVGVLKVYFTLRSKLLLDSASNPDILNNEVDNGKVVTILEAEIVSGQSGLIIPVKAIDGHLAQFTIVSLLSNDEGSVAEELGGKDFNTPKTYTAADMAGLGIGMLLLGALLTIAFGGVIWVKRFDINLPYTSQSNE